MSDPQYPVDSSEASRQSRRGREEGGSGEDYRGAADWSPTGERDRHAGSSLLGVLVAGLVVLMLVVAAYFLMPRDRGNRPGVGEPVRVRLPEPPTTPSVPDLPRPPTLQAN